MFELTAAKFWIDMYYSFFAKSMNQGCHTLRLEFMKYIPRQFI